MQIPKTESKRVKEFRLSIAKKIPRFPNNKASLQVLEAKSLGNLLIDYTNWAIRYVSPRTRQINIESTASSDPRWKGLAKEIEAFLEKVKTGQDLTPHLSLQPHTRGYTPASSIPSANTDKWEDKDFLLNVMGYHHFHLGTALEKSGRAVRTDVVMFASLTREKFNVVALFDHSVFEMNREPTALMNAERERLWKIFDERSMRGVPADSAVIQSPIATSGHSLYLVRLADKYAHLINEIDPKLDDMSFVQSLYEKSGLPLPKKIKLRWHLQYLTLGLLDEEEGMLFVLRHGPN